MKAMTKSKQSNNGFIRLQLFPRIKRKEKNLLSVTVFEHLNNTSLIFIEYPSGRKVHWINWIFFDKENGSLSRMAGITLNTFLKPEIKYSSQNTRRRVIPNYHFNDTYTLLHTSLFEWHCACLCMRHSNWSKLKINE